MRRTILAIVMCSCVSGLVAEGAVTVTPSVPAIAQGGSVTFTVSVVPDTYIQTVYLSYEGESSVDEKSSPPFVFSHQFNNPMLDLTVTATVTYSNGPPEVASTDIDVAGITITGPATPLRGWPAAYTARTNPTGITGAQFNWSCDTPHGTVTFTDLNADGDDKSVWAGAMVADSTLSCSAALGGAQTQPTSKPVTPAPRNWSTPITCAQDNDAGWGEIPEPGVKVGMNCLLIGPEAEGYFTPPPVAPVGYRAAWTMATASTGPNESLKYVSSSTLACARETLINKHIKADGPAVGALTWQEANLFCLASSPVCLGSGPECYVDAVRHHEYRGTPDVFKSLEGHQGRIELCIRDGGYDPRKNIEDLTATDESTLSSLVNERLFVCSVNIHFFSDDLYMLAYGPNWGGDGSLGQGYSATAFQSWDEFNQVWVWTWSDCIYGPLDF